MVHRPAWNQMSTAHLSTSVQYQPAAQQLMKSGALRYDSIHSSCPEELIILNNKGQKRGELGISEAEQGTYLREGARLVGLCPIILHQH